MGAFLLTTRVPETMASMTFSNTVRLVSSCVALALIASCAPGSDAELAVGLDGVPMFEPDPDWHGPVPANWIIGPGTGIYVDDRDHTWALHRPERISPEDFEAAFDPSIEDCCIAAPPLFEIDPVGSVVQTMGSVEADPMWPLMPHGVFVDHNDFVWVATSIHHQVMKFTRDGEHILTIGEFDRVGGSNDTSLLGGSADIHVDPETNEVFVADGYNNARVIVFDGDTGSYLRHWGAYGERPDDDADFEPGPTAPQFALPHGIAGSRDGLIYVADRTNSRVQVFQRDGTFVQEGAVREGRSGAFDVAFSHDPDQSYLYVADGSLHKIWIMRRDDMSIVGEFGSEGTGPGEMGRPHNIATDTRGNVYVAEADPGRRWQKFNFVGTRPTTD
jgi:DNA-binding beta-propeller fold protein YncE